MRPLSRAATRIAVCRNRMAQGNGTQQLPRIGNTEFSTDCVGLVEHREEQSAEARVVRGKQQSHRRHRCIDRPVRGAPCVDVFAETGVRLVRFRVAIDIRIWVRKRQCDDRRTQQAGPCKAPAFVGGKRQVPEPETRVVAENEQRPPLGLASTRGARREVHKVTDDGLRNVGICEVACHAARLDGAAQFHGMASVVSGAG